jgi:hypothetical protein
MGRTSASRGASSRVEVLPACPLQGPAAAISVRSCCAAASERRTLQVVAGSGKASEDVGVDGEVFMDGIPGGRSPDRIVGRLADVRRES